MAEELRPCPFCGNIPEDDGYGDGEYFCKTCDLWGICPDWWNTRAEPERHVLRIDVAKEEDQYVAVCAEPDIAAQANTVWDVLYEWGRLFAAYKALEKEEDQ